MNKQQILDEISKTKEHLINIEKMVGDCESERWKPDSCDAYYYIDAFGNVLSQIETGHPSDSAFWKSYNCFQTREQAEQEAEKILIRRQLEDIARRLNKNEKTDWNNEEQDKYFIRFSHGQDVIQLESCWKNKLQGVIYCLDKKFLDVVLEEIGEQRLMRYLKGE